MRALATLVAGLMSLFCASALGATIHADTTSDERSADGHCSLREALAAANTDTAPFAGAGECTAGSGTDTIVLPAGQFTLGIAGRGEDANATGDLDVLSAVTIDGAGAAVTQIDANGIDRVLDVHTGADLTLSGVTIAGGLTRIGGIGGDHVGATGAQGVGDQGQPGESGGGILNAGSLTVIDSTIRDNVTGAGGKGGGGYGGSGAPNGGNGFGGDGGHGGDGGGIFTTGPLTLTRATVTANTTGVGGEGGIGVGGDAGTGAGTGGFGGGGFGGRGGDGAGVAGSGAGVLTIDQSSITGNHTGAGGPGGFGDGGVGGPRGSGSLAGGQGGGGDAGDGGRGGAGAGVFSGATLTATDDLIAANVGGAGGPAGDGFGGNGGPGGTSGGTGGTGGGGTGTEGGNGGGGVGIAIPFGATGSATNVTVTANTSGTGGAGGQGNGGTGGTGGTGGNGGTGGTAQGGNGGSRGPGTAIGDDGTLTLLHATITSNHSGAEGAAGTLNLGTGGAAGSGGQPGGSGTFPIPGVAGTPAQGDGAVGNVSPSVSGVTTTLQNTIVASNDLPNCSSAGAHVNGGQDISFGDATCPGANVDPLLAALADNGGPTMTQALEPNSPALDAVPATGAGCAATDQRGVSRPQGTACDIGAYEHAPPDVTTGAATGISTSAATIQGQVVPNARSTTYHSEFGPTTAYGSSTASRDAGAGVTAVSAGEPIGGLAPATTYHYRLLASNAEGTTAGLDRTFTTLALPGGGGAPPVFLAASLSPRVFAVDTHGSAETLVSARAKKGTTFRYTLSENARVLFTIERVLPGRKVGHACRKQTSANRHRRACKRVLRAGRFAVTARAGVNTHRFSGRIGRRSLVPGSYRATLAATDAAGKVSKPKQLTFKVVRR